ncbi:26S proteasome non-ATPase regulatory subunit 4 homolog isoform X2 [Tanacetum coccineum]
MSLASQRMMMFKGEEEQSLLLTTSLKMKLVIEKEVNGRSRLSLFYNSIIGKDNHTRIESIGTQWTCDFQPWKRLAIMICIDNSRYVPEGGYVFKTQLDAIRLYARAKIKSNPKNRLGVATLGLEATRWPHQPHSDIERFLTYTLDIPWGGDFNLIVGLDHSPLGFASIPLDMKRRLLVFVAGPGYLLDLLLDFGQHLKKIDIALDVVSFEDEDQEFDAYKTKCLRSFVAAANRANNSHFARVPRHSSSSSVRDILVSSKILRPSEAEAVPLVEEVIPKMMNNNNKKKKKKKLTRNRSKKKNHHSQEDPQEEPALSSSSSPPPVILPAHFQVPQKYKNQNQLVFGSWQMHQLLDVLSPSS